MSIKQHLWTVAAAALATAVLAACASQATPSATALPATSGSGGGGFDPCAILTQADAEAFFGAPAKPGEKSETNGKSFTCTYATADASNQQTLTLLIRRSTNASDANLVWNSALGASTGAQAVSGLGEEAFFNPGLNQLNIKKGNNWIVLGGEAAGKDFATALIPVGKAVVGRLP